MLINAPTVEQFDTLKKPEVEALIAQINQAFAQGIPPQESVTFPAFILAQLLKTVKHLEQFVPEQTGTEMEDLLSSLGKEESTEAEEKE